MASANGPILMEIIIEVNLKLALKEAVVYTLLKMEGEGHHSPFSNMGWGGGGGASIIPRLGITVLEVTAKGPAIVTEQDSGSNSAVILQ